MRERGETERERETERQREGERKIDRQAEKNARLLIVNSQNHLRSSELSIQSRNKKQKTQANSQTPPLLLP